MTDANLRKKPWSPRSLLIMAVLIAVAFSAGFLWQFVEARSARAERDELRREVALQALSVQLAAGVIQAGVGSYEEARVLMSDFFTDLQDDMESAPAEATGDLRAILSQRDTVITALSRSDPEANELLRRIFARYQTATGGPGAGIAIPAPRTTDTPPASDDTLGEG